jgi:ABC-2 type transport system permease protein
MNSATALSWFARHELRLAWREWLAMMTGGRRRRTRAAAIGLLLFAAILHFPAWAVVGRFAAIEAPLDKSSGLIVTATILLSWALILSQAIESVTRVFYARADLDLIMSSPATLASILSVRVAAIALTVTGMALALATPFIDVLAIGGGARWLLAFGVVVAVGLSAAAFAIAVTIALFRLIGPSRTRLMAQILAAIIGAGFVIALQIAAVMSYGTLSRFAVLTSEAAASYAPAPDSVLWLPARAVLGDGEALLLLLSASLLSLGIVMAALSSRFADTAANASAQAVSRRRSRGITAFRGGSRPQALRRKELLLLRRDPWLVSQTLMQLLYLVPPALFLWRSFSDHSAATALITPVIVMAAGQLAGGLAWLTISGEDARSCCDRATSTVARDPRQDRGGLDCDRGGFRTTGRDARASRAATGRGGGNRRHSRRSVVNRNPVLVPCAPRDLCGSLFLDRMGRNRSVSLGASRSGFGQRVDDDRNHRRGLEAQPAEGVSGCFAAISRPVDGNRGLIPFQPYGSVLRHAIHSAISQSGRRTTGHVTLRFRHCRVDWLCGCARCSAGRHTPQRMPRDGAGAATRHGRQLPAGYGWKR